jgi:hypothetical protein
MSPAAAHHILSVLILYAKIFSTTGLRLLGFVIVAIEWLPLSCYAVHLYYHRHSPQFLAAPMDLQTYREKLADFGQSVYSSPDEALPEDWPVSPMARVNPRHASASAKRVAELAATVETLKKRSAQTFRNHTAVEQGAPTMAAEDGAEDGAEVDVELHLRRIRAIADKINDFSAQQSQAMVEMHQIQQRLAASADVQGVAIPAINFEGAVTASVVLDAEGNFLLSYETLDINQEVQEAAALADHLRGTYGVAGSRRPTRTPGIANDMSMLWREPLQLAKQIWQSLGELISGSAWTIFSPSPARQARNRVARQSLSLTDAILWLGGGVIGRVALNLLLAAVPALWSVAVAAITGMTAYALYRATLSPRLDFGLAYRVLLIIGGLLIGGHFGI